MDYILDDYTDNYGRTFRAQMVFRECKTMREFHEKLLYEIPYGKFYYVVFGADEADWKFVRPEDLKPYVESYKVKTAIKTVGGPGDHYIKITLVETDWKEPTGFKKWLKDKKSGRVFS